jgi:peroxiredoxin
MCHYHLILLSDLPKHNTAINYKAFTYYEQLVDNFARKVKINQPITFLINPEGKIVWKYVGTREIRPPNRILNDAVEKYL